jgi:glucosamine-6-phosphate deaminase
MEVFIFDTKVALGEAAAGKGATLISKTLEEKDRASIILATGASQFEMLSELVKTDVDWSKVTVFHLDEYIGIPVTHPASFRKYLNERFVELAKPAAFHAINGEADPAGECARLNGIISKHEIDVAFVGIGENAHLAFNDPPADFNTTEPYIVVDLDRVCREQQLGEGWFPSLKEVPERAISMSVKQIMKSKAIVCTVPDARKAEAVQKTLEGKVVPEVPASVLQNHPQTCLYLDQGSASLLKPE